MVGLLSANDCWQVFGKDEAEVPVHMVLWSCPSEDPRFKERDSVQLEERFPLGTRYDARCVASKLVWSLCVYLPVSLSLGLSTLCYTLRCLQADLVSLVSASRSLYLRLHVALPPS